MPLAPELNEFSTASPRIASYNYTDLDEGAGYVKYYGFAADTSSATTYGLTKSVVFSNPAYSGADSSASPFDADFDLSFNIAKTLNGDVIANIPMWCYGSINNSSTVAVTLTIYHYNATTGETSLGTATSDSIDNNAGENTENKLLCFRIPITSTHFKRTDILRMNISATVVRSDGTSRGGVRHDPAGRTPSGTQGNFESSVLSFHVPFRIDS